MAEGDGFQNMHGRHQLKIDFYFTHAECVGSFFSFIPGKLV